MSSQKRAVIKQEEQRFLECCANLNLDEETQKRAWSVWLSARSCFSQDELQNLKAWFACVLYLTTHPDFQVGLCVCVCV